MVRVIKGQEREGAQREGRIGNWEKEESREFGGRRR